MKTLFDQDAESFRKESGQDPEPSVEWEAMQPHDFLGPSDREGRRMCEASIRSRAFARVSFEGIRFPDALRLEIAESYANLVRYGETYRDEIRAWTIEDVPMFYRGAAREALEGQSSTSLLEPSDPDKLAAPFDQKGYDQVTDE